MSHLSDEEILNYIQSGDSTKQDMAFRQLYRDNFGIIEGYIVKNNGTQDRAKDIFHDGMIVFFNKAKKGLELTSSIGTYLYAICHNLWLNHLRKYKREAPMNESLKFVPIKEDLQEQIEVKEKNETIIQLLGKLGGDCQRILYLFYFQRMKMEKIKEEFGLGSAQAAKNKASQCRKKLRKMVHENPYYKNILTD